MLGSIGLPELIILGLSALWAWAGWRIFQKAGYPGWIGLGVLVPPVAVVLVIFPGSGGLADRETASERAVERSFGVKRRTWKRPGLGSRPLSCTVGTTPR